MTTTSHQVEINASNSNVFSDDLVNNDDLVATNTSKNINKSNGTTNNFLNNASQNNDDSSNNIDGGEANAYNQRISEAGKRKKLKTRNVAMPQFGYCKDHLDAWLESCLKDTTNTQLSSSSEFLDYNPTTITPATAVETNKVMNKKDFSQQQPNSSVKLLYSAAVPAVNSQQQQQQQQYKPQQQSYSHPSKQQKFGRTQYVINPSNFNASGFNNTSFNLGYQRNMPHMRNPSNLNQRSSTMFPSGSASGLYDFGCNPQNDGSQDFASLPPIINMLGGGGGGFSSETENNSTDVLDGSGSNPNMARGFRFSDPCLLNPSDNDSKISGQNTPDQRNQRLNPTEMENNKFFSALMEQINLLHETNSKICRNLHETKVDIEALKHAPTWGLRHRRDSLSGLSTHSQPMIFGGGGFGTQSPAPTYHSGAYTPGLMTDVVREVKEAARVREDALLNRVKALVEERQWSMNESNLRMMRDIEELKAQMNNLRSDRKEANRRINHLEAENKYMRQMLASIYNNRNIPDIIYENEALRSRKSLPHPHPTTRRTQSFNLQYGTIHHQPVSSSLSLEGQEESLNVIDNNSDMISASNAQRLLDKRNVLACSEGGGGGGNIRDKNKDVMNPINVATASNTNIGGQPLSPPTFTLVSNTAEENKRHVEKSLRKQGSNEGVKMTNEYTKLSSGELQQELLDAITARKKADDRIIALEELVRNFQVSETTIPADNSSHGGGINIVGGEGSVVDDDNDAILNVHRLSSFKWYDPSLDTSTNIELISQNNKSNNNKRYSPHTSNATANVNLTNSPPKLSVAGPITDL